MTEKQIRELVRQYAEGTISTGDRHLLERYALDDPFLFESLEGFAKHKHGASITEQFYGPSNVTLIPIRRFFSIAASFIAIAAAVVVMKNIMTSSPVEQAHVNLQLIDEASDGDMVFESFGHSTLESPEDQELLTMTSNKKRTDTAITFDNVKGINDIESVNERVLKERIEHTSTGAIQSSKHEGENPDKLYSISSNVTSPQVITDGEVLAEEEYIDQTYIGYSSHDSSEGDDTIVAVSSKVGNRRHILENDVVSAAEDKINYPTDDRIQESDSTLVESTNLSSHDDNDISELHNKEELTRIIEGYVFDNDKMPLEGVKIANEHQTAQAITDNNGYYKILLNPETNTISASLPGYLSIGQFINVSTDKQYNFILEGGSPKSLPAPRFFPLIGEQKLRRNIKTVMKESNCATFDSLSITLAVQIEGSIGRIKTSPKIPTRCVRAIRMAIRDSGSWASEPKSVGGPHSFTIHFDE